MGTILNANQFSPNNLSAPGLYINNQPPPSYIPGAATNVAGVVGTASWGPLNSPILIGSPQEATTKLGGIGTAALTDNHDLCTDIALAMLQGPITIWAVRVSDGTGVTASVALKDTTTPTALTGITISGKYTGVAGNGISVVISAASATNTFNVVINGFPGTNPETYPNLPSTGFWTALNNALLNGITGVRGPSLLVTPSSVDVSAIAPAVGTFALAGGTDGRSAITSSDLLGSDAAYPGTGMYALANLNPVVSALWLAGVTDTTELASMQAFVDANAILGGVALPTGTSTTTAQSTVSTAGVRDYNIVYLKDWVYWYDTVNALVRLVSPYGPIMGLITAQAPQDSPTNKQVSGIIGTERNSPYTGNQPYSLAELGVLEQSGILVITNPIPSGNAFGVYTGNNTSLNLAQTPVEYSRMTNFLDQSFNATLGLFIGQNQTQQPKDPLRSQVRHALNTFLQGLQDNQQIDAYQVTCTMATSGNPQAGINTPATIAQHFLYAFAAVRYLSSVRYFVMSLQGGTTVVMSQAA